MLHYYCSIAAFDRWDAPIFRETVEELVSLDLLEPVNSDPSRLFKTTERGKALISMWCDTPLPEKRYVDPRFGAAA
ncbi:hypothetical protein [Mesorhizobium sp.]|uniref:hypothetical protein n=1 Tax=Mesorhizobium sp. TaxID=1871066 RepID=UPI000FE4676E|nr:hypothetical protein [Mesorhizobium sp.]RWG24585.1 MAG: hypothetical protein EOQ60_32110 [Mesorhizobium sp.]